MKTTGFLAILALIFVFQSANARELSPGTIMITGETSFDDSKIRMDTSYSQLVTDTTTLDVTASYFLIKNFGVGLMIGNEDSRTTDGVNTTNTSINISGPMAVYSIDINPDFNINFSLGIFKVTGDMDDGAGTALEFDGDGTFILLSVAYFFNDNVALNIGIRRTDGDIELYNRFLANPPESASMSDNGNMIGFMFLF